MAVFDDDAQRIVLVDLKPYDVVGAAVTTVRVASEDYATEPGDTPANALYYGVLRDDIFIDRAMFTGDNVGGLSLPDFGGLTINNPKQPDEGALFDEWLDAASYTWAGRNIDIYVLERGAAYSTKTQVFSGIINELEYQENAIRFSIKSKAYLLDNPLQTNRYAGSGGDEGGSDTEDKNKPLCFGRNANIEPLFVDTSTLRYQYHDGAVSTNNEARDKGDALVVTTDYTDDLTDGFIDLVAAADGQVTMDVQGSTLGGTYSAQPADIMNYIAGTLKGVSVNSASITAVNSAAGYEVGYYTGSNNPNTLEVLTELAKTFNGYYGLNRSGQFDVGILEKPTGSADIELEEQDIELGSLQRQPLRQVVHKVVVNARPNWTVQDQSSFAGAVSEADKALYSKEYQITVTAEDSSVLTKYPEAQEMIVNTVIYDQTDAESLANDLLTYWKTPRSLFSMVTNLRPLSVDLNDTVQLTHSRYGLASGDKFSVIRFREYYLKNRTELTVAG